MAVALLELRGSEEISELFGDLGANLPDDAIFTLEGDAERIGSDDPLRDDFDAWVSVPSILIRRPAADGSLAGAEELGRLKLVKAFKFKASFPKVKFGNLGKAFKVKFNMPKLQFGKMFSGIGKGVKSLGKGIEKGVRGYGKALERGARGVGKFVEGVGNTLMNDVLPALSESMPGGAQEMPPEEMPPEEFPPEELPPEEFPADPYAAGYDSPEVQELYGELGFMDFSQILNTVTGLASGAQQAGGGGLSRAGSLVGTAFGPAGGAIGGQVGRVADNLVRQRQQRAAAQRQQRARATQGMLRLIAPNLAPRSPASRPAGSRPAPAPQRAFRPVLRQQPGQPARVVLRETESPRYSGGFPADNPAPAPAPTETESFFEKYKNPLMIGGGVVLTGTVLYAVLSGGQKPKGKR